MTFLRMLDQCRVKARDWRFVGYNGLLCNELGFGVSGACMQNFGARVVSLKPKL